MPSRRFWELEPGDVDLDAVSAAPEDLGLLVLIEFATVYGNDFFVVPMEVDIGSVTSLSSVLVANTFGEVTPVPTAAAADAKAGRSPFRVFEPTASERPGSDLGTVPWLVALPTVVGGLAGQPVEDVLLARTRRPTSPGPSSAWWLASSVGRRLGPR